MGLRTAFRNFAFSRGYVLTENLRQKNAKAFIERFRENFISCDLIRIGGDADGGYLVPNILDDIDFCFSPGVDYTATFERHLSESFGIKSFMADASVTSSPLEDANFQFIPKFLGSRTNGDFITLSDWLDQSVDADQRNLILQMEIEGAEYDVLVYEPSSVLERFAVMVIEFHFIDRLFLDDYSRMMTGIFEKIYKNFSICHIHPNNCCGVAKFGGVEIPRVVEITFLRNDYAEKLRSFKAISLPHALDRRNVKDERDIPMPEIWWKV
jgi:hypothetical protein